MSEWNIRGDEHYGSRKELSLGMLDISLQLACGLAHLHEECSIIHFDIVRQAGCANECVCLPLFCVLFVSHDSQRKPGLQYRNLAMSVLTKAVPLRLLISA